MSIAVCNQTAEDGVHQYLQEIRSIPMLSEREERELALCCAKGDEDAIRRLVSANLRRARCTDAGSDPGGQSRSAGCGQKV